MCVVLAVATYGYTMDSIERWHVHSLPIFTTDPDPLQEDHVRLFHLFLSSDGTRVQNMLGLKYCLSLLNYLLSQRYYEYVRLLVP